MPRPDVVTIEPWFRPSTRSTWYQATLPLALILGAGIGLVGTAVSPSIIVLAFAALVSSSFLRRRRMHQALRDNDEAVALLAAGEHERAASVFDELCRRARSIPTLHCVFVYNRAVVHIECGEHERAVSLLVAVVQAGWLRSSGALGVYYASVLGRLAMAEALRGQLAQAEAWQRLAHANTSEAKRGSLLLVDAIILARRGKDEAVLSTIDKGWRRAENLLPTKHLRSIRLLEAFCVERLAGKYRVESKQDQLSDALRAAGQAPPGAYDFLAIAWPDLASFVRKHLL